MKTMEKLHNIFIIFIHNEFHSKEKKKKKMKNERRDPKELGCAPGFKKKPRCPWHAISSPHLMIY